MKPKGLNWLAKIGYGHEELSQMYRLPSSGLALMTSLKTAILWPRLDDEFEDCHPLAPGRKLLSFDPSGCCLPATIFNAIQFY
jgi:hypothetical protein